MKSIILTMLALFIFTTGCEKKLEPIKVGEMNEYHDPAFGFKIKYPKEWKSLGEAGKAIFAKSQEVLNKFLDPRTGEEGAQVSVEVIPYKGETADALTLAGKEELKQTWRNIQINPEEKTNVAGKEATKISYGIPVTSKKQISGYEIYVPGDTAVYKITCLGYGDHFQAHNDVFTAIINSFELPIIVVKKGDEWVPSSNLETFNTNYFTFQYPANLETVPTKKGPKDDLAIELRADRLDCSIRFDVFSAHNLSVEKVWEQNKNKYNAKTTGQITIDGQNSYWADYSPRKDINSRVYFVVKNDKVIRITVNYFAQKKDIYFPTFENIVKSIKLK